LRESKRERRTLKRRSDESVGVSADNF